MVPRAPEPKRSDTVTKSVAGGSKIRLDVCARTSTGVPRKATQRSVWWMPVAVIMPAGACLGSRRQLERSMPRNRSWLMLASNSSGLPSVPSSSSLRTCSKPGS